MLRRVEAGTWRKEFELLRSGFLADGRYFSIEALPGSYGQWVARLVCVPGNRERAIRKAAYKPELRIWADGLSLQEIEELAAKYLS